MKAAVLREYGKLSIENIELSGPARGEVRIRVLASGLCHSDYHIILGKFPMPLPSVLGHEVAGVIEAVGDDVPGFKVGDTVVTCVSAFCGECPQCQTGHTYRCDDKPGAPAEELGSRLHKEAEPIYQMGNLGGFAEEMVVHHRSVVKVPEQIPATSAALLGCAVVTGVGAALNGARIHAGSTVAILGCGGVGLNAVQGARIAGASKVIAVDINADKFPIAKQFGATHTIQGGPDAVAEIIELTKGGVDYAIEVIGRPDTGRQAIDMLCKGGTAVLVGMGAVGEEVGIPITPFMMAEKRVIGSLMGSSAFQMDIPKLADYYLQGKLKLDELVTATLPLEQINEGYQQLAEGKVTRSVLVFD